MAIAGSPVPLPPDTSAGIVIDVDARSDATWSTRFGASPLTSSRDEICFDFRLGVQTQAWVLGTGVPWIYLGCRWPGARGHVCGTFRTVPNADEPDFLDPDFFVTELSVDPGQQTGFQGFLCAWPANIPFDILPGEIQRRLERELDAGLRTATEFREHPGIVTSPPVPGTCSPPPPVNLLRESGCAVGTTPADRDARCHAFVTGVRPEATPDGRPLVRARCESRTSREPCEGDGTCGRGLLRECYRPVGRCGPEGSLGSCTTDRDCPSGVLCVGSGVCRDREPVCYWNIEVDRIEMLPSGLEVVLAHDEDDVSLTAIREYSTLVEGALCRGEPAPFDPLGIASGSLGPAAGARVTAP